MKIFRKALLIATVVNYSCQTMPEQAVYADFPEYKGTDLGLTYSPEKSIFKVWSPSVESMRLKIYEKGEGAEPLNEHEMEKQGHGVWSVELTGDMKGKFYAFQARFEGAWMSEVPDPYVKAVGVNGKRAMVVNLSATNPEGWENDRRPELRDFTDIVIYELHIRDLSTHENSGIVNKGKFLGLTERGTTSPEGEKTGLDHLLDLGVTHVHLLPIYDYKSVDESKPESNQFNWGYDPQNYNTPEGSYSTNPHDGAVRIREFKELIKALHENGLRVIMDVVYNHTYETETSNFNQLVPGYYYRQNEEGGFSDASACGNETASERAMFRKFMLESVRSGRRNEPL